MIEIPLEKQLRKELKREVVNLLIPLVAGATGLFLLVSATEYTPLALISLGIFLSGIGIGVFLGQLLDFCGKFLPYYRVLKK